MSLATLTVTAQKNPSLDGSVGGNFSVTLDWLSTDGGAVSLAICSTYSAAQLAANPFSFQPAKILGVIRSIETIPGLLGAPATNPPTDLYDITLLDKYSLDIAGGQLADRSATVAQKVVPASKIIIDSEITLTIANAGNAKNGRIIMEFEDIGGHRF